VSKSGDSKKVPFYDGHYRPSKIKMPASRAKIPKTIDGITNAEMSAVKSTKIR